MVQWGGKEEEVIQSRGVPENNNLHSGTLPLEKRCQMSCFRSVLTLEALEV